MLVENIPPTVFFLTGKIISTTYIILSVIGWIGNGLIVFVTIRSKNLRGPCNVFIALQAASDVLIQLSHIPFTYFAYTETLVSYYTCWKINIIFVSGMDFSNTIILFIAVDRFMSAKHPHFYQSLNPTLYIGGTVSFLLAYCIVIKFVTFLSLTDDETLCLIAQSVTGLMENVWFGSQFIVNCAVLAVYCALTNVLSNVSAHENRKINRSLKTLIVVNLCGWFLTLLGCTVALLITENNRFVMYLEMPFGLFANINLAAPFFIYYTRSTLYRREFRRMLLAKCRIVPSTISCQQPSGFSSSQ